MTAARRLRRWAAASLVAGSLALTAGCAGSDRGPTATGSGSVATAPSIASSAPSAPINADAQREAAVADLLARRARAMNQHDRAAFVATLADPASAFGERQLQAYSAFTTLPIRNLTYGTIQVAPALGADRLAVVGADAWVARVNATYSLSGYDSVQRSFESYLTVTMVDGQWKVADDVDGGTRPQPWDLVGMRAVKNATAIVIGNVGDEALRRHLASLTAAAAVVDAVWRHPWPHRLVAVVPKTTAEFSAQLAAEPATVEQVAAVTDGAAAINGVATPPGGADRIVVNPQAFAQLTAVGQRVVLTHESTHVAIRAGTAGRVPLWLSEGIADLVGYRAQGATLPTSKVIAALTAKVREQGMPRALPVDAEFNAAQTTIEPAYNEAWIAVTMLFEQYGPQRLTTFYRTASSTGPDSAVATSVRRAFAGLGTSEAAFTTRWLTRVRDLTTG